MKHKQRRKSPRAPLFEKRLYWEDLPEAIRQRVVNLLADLFEGRLREAMAQEEDTHESR